MRQIQRRVLPPDGGTTQLRHEAIPWVPRDASAPSASPALFRGSGGAESIACEHPSISPTRTVSHGRSGPGLLFCGRKRSRPTDRGNVPLMQLQAGKSESGCHHMDDAFRPITRPPPDLAESASACRTEAGSGRPPLNVSRMNWACRLAPGRAMRRKVGSPPCPLNSESRRNAVWHVLA